MTPEAAITFLDEAAHYFEKRPTGGEDGAHWSNVYNAKNCREIAQLLADAKLGLLVREGGEALAERLLETLQMMASTAMNLSLDDWSKHASAVQEAAALLSMQEMVK